MQTLLTREGCLRRQKRMAEAMGAGGYDLLLTGHARTIYYFTGALLPPETPAALLMEQDGRTVLISPETRPLAADEHVAVETYSIQRVISDAHADVARVLPEHLQNFRDGNWAVELSHTPAAYVRDLQAGSLADAGPLIRSLRKRKEEDEIAEIRRSLGFSKVAYDAARTAIRPGATEIDVHDAMLDAATQLAGHTLTFAGDFAAGLRCVRAGGPPSKNRLKNGDLYILDLFPACAFYFGDTCRTFVVGEPFKAQSEAWQLVADTLAMAEEIIRPGVAAKDVYTAVRDRLAGSAYGSSFWHHAGHGVGLHGHEAPRLIPGSADIIEAGDVIAVEPALYSEELRGGIRLENTYAVREAENERLFNYPLDL